VDRFQVAPLFYNESRRAWAAENVAEQAPYGRNVRVWPLFRYKRDHDRQSLRFLELWFGADVGGAERNLAPLWTLYTRERAGARVEDELLWGLARHRRGGDLGRDISVFPFFRYARDEAGANMEWSALGGLVGGGRSGLQREFRLLYWLRFPRQSRAGCGGKNDNP
jgi:hypothetical protein